MQHRPSKSHASLGGSFFDPVAPAAFPERILRYRNQRWARRVGLDGLDTEAWRDHFGSFTPLPGSLEKPLALRYHGHQFQSYNPDLGDGRGFLFAQLRDLEDGRLLDLGTKGSGRTPWSRGADGRLTLKGGVREVLATEMLEALGVDTSKSFSLIETGEELERGDEPSPTRASVLIRLSHSHIRIGTFQRLAYLREHDNLAILLDYAIRTYMPEAWRDSRKDRAVAFMEAVAARVALTGARWMAAGFVHGVLNTDNINITGESFDYGPWRFLPVYEPGFTAAYFDQSGLYAFGRQPDALAWNLTRLAECLLPLTDTEPLEEALNSFWPRFQGAMAEAVLDRLGLAPSGPEADASLVTALFTFLFETRAPYEQVFFDWYGGEASAGRAARSPSAEHYASPSFSPVRLQMGLRAMREDIDLAKPYFQRARPRTMLIEEVEAIWAPISEADDWSVFQRVLGEIAEMRDAYGR
ncbi:YdiU family protein [Arsenicitalea aurantiaca]|uniref:Protein nucleotidyltransferase YdiU n=1 Tax=Arsenicitalea aurantiaca TaxID=1783274 RepID=A0A433X7K5_9HYPH|nr:YdiU family protein [Arsenicitalea aurantiaca]RUT30030.1 YdiU family protein [Arsenicitalea aurantiaca]